MGKFDPEDQLACLPDELMVRISEYLVEDDTFMISSKVFKKLKSPHKYAFVSKYACRLVGKPRKVYLEAVGNRIINEAPLVNVKVKDRKSDNLKKFLDALKLKNKLAEFEFGADGEPQYRGISIFHCITSSFSDQPKTIINFDKHVSSLGANAMINMGHLAKQVQDPARISSFLENARFLGGGDGHVAAVIDCLRFYLVSLHTA